MKKVLIVYATAGIGHAKAAFAVRDALEERGKDISYEIIDVLVYTNFLLKWIYHRLYILLVQYTPSVWAVIYHSLDVPWVYSRIKGARTLLNRLNSGKFAEYLRRTQPDIIVSTHFFSSEVVSSLKRKGVIKSRLITIPTDFKLHTYWVSDETDLFVVANEDMKEELKRVGISEQKIKVYGVPIEPRFCRPLDKEALYKKLVVDRNLFKILIASGGFGVGPVKALVNELGSLDLPIQLLIVCGKNRFLYEDIALFSKGMNNPIKLYGFVDNMHELMEVSDLLISKTGGLTTSEALAKELPMIVISPVPGQEARNSDFIVSKGAAIREDSPSKVKEKVKELFDNRQILNKMIEIIRQIKRPDSALKTADLINQL